MTDNKALENKYCIFPKTIYINTYELLLIGSQLKRLDFKTACDYTYFIFLNFRIKKNRHISRKGQHYN